MPDRRIAGDTGAFDAVMALHFEEHCGCDYCTHPSWCGADSHHGEIHDGEEQSPTWPCAVVLAVTGDATQEAFFEREGAAWEAWARETHPDWFGQPTPASAEADAHG